MKVEPLTSILRCTQCQKYTTRQEAAMRMFRQGHCAYCGGDLKPYIEKGKSDGR